MAGIHTKVLILAGGKGSRMNSPLPKVLHKVGGTTLIDRVLESVSAVDERPYVVVGHGREAVEAHLGSRAVPLYQAEQLGTGHAVSIARERCEQDGVEHLLVLPGDHPFISPEDIRALIELHDTHTGPLSKCSVRVPSYEGMYGEFDRAGRVVRDHEGRLVRIVEYKDATDEERAITEVNAGYYIFDTDWLWSALSMLKADNAAGEYYLTDVVGRAVAEGCEVGVHILADPVGGMGVNTSKQLLLAEGLIS